MNITITYTPDEYQAVLAALSHRAQVVANLEALSDPPDGYWRKRHEDTLTALVKTRRAQLEEEGLHGR